MNHRGLDQGWSCGVGRGRCRRKRACLGSNSSHLEKLMEGERRFCTYPGSLPPHSIIRQSIMSTKKEENRKAVTTGPGVWIQLSATFIPAWYLLVLCRADFEWTHTKERAYFPQTTCSVLIHVAGAVCRWCKHHHYQQNSWEVFSCILMRLKQSCLQHIRNANYLCPRPQVKSVTAPVTVAAGVPKWTSVKAVSIFKCAY